MMLTQEVSLQSFVIFVKTNKNLLGKVRIVIQKNLQPI
jgi:hypothetical protein